MSFLEICKSNAQPMVMGILNITPDSFSDGGLVFSNGKPDANKLFRRIEVMVAEGADILDLGGESTRPGAKEVPLQQEMDRILPVLEVIKNHFDVFISVDSSSPQLIREAVAIGMDLWNDVRALSRPGAVDAAVQLDLPVCLMHMRGEPQTMQQQVQYDDVLSEICDFFEHKIQTLKAAGYPISKLILDPGFGFGKSVQHNLTLLNRLSAFSRFGLPLLAGISRKSTIGKVLGKPEHERLYGSLACAVIAAYHGARIVRVHDVAATVDALKMLSAVRGEFSEDQL